MNIEELLRQYMPSDRAVRDIGEFFGVFSHETRIKIILMLSVSELNVNDLSKCLQCNQSTVSHQLRILKDRKIVTSYRKGKEIFYSVANSFITEVLFSAVKATDDLSPNLSERASMREKKGAFA